MKSLRPPSATWHVGGHPRLYENLFSNRKKGQKNQREKEKKRKEKGKAKQRTEEKEVRPFVLTGSPRETSRCPTPVLL